jgi:prepilin-type N-terminal cleavage/methylation domain-containing protein
MRHRLTSNLIHPLKGFTLIEVLIVMAIIGISAAMVLPMLGSRNDLNVSAAARKVVADIAWAQNMAVATQSRWHVRFSASGYNVAREQDGVLTIVEHPVDQSPLAVIFGVASPEPVLQGVALGTVEFDETTHLVFDQLGTPRTGEAATPLADDGTVVLQAGARSVTIRIQPLTGEISVE